MKMWPTLCPALQVFMSVCAMHPVLTAGSISLLQPCRWSIMHEQVAADGNLNICCLCMLYFMIPQSDARGLVNLLKDMWI